MFATYFDRAAGVPTGRRLIATFDSNERANEIKVFGRPRLQFISGGQYIQTAALWRKSENPFRLPPSAHQLAGEFCGQVTTLWISFDFFKLFFFFHGCSFEPLAGVEFPLGDN